MAKIEFRENKILKLTNVLSRKVPEAELFSQNKQIAMMDNWIKAKGYETQGPLIMYTGCVKGVDGDGKPIIDARVMIQLKTDKVRLELPYKFEQEKRIEHCLFARFNDEAEKLQFATNKLTLFAYENDLELTGETYMVFVKEEGSKLLADVFMPLKNGSVETEAEE
ncbi:MAG: hypothetical protein LBT20_06500 [Clostridiales bacterium]|jgi:hypothetical protein|nr:hypothetical protein [Clostridiales bacterium]